MKKTRSFSWGAAAGVVALLAFIILLENITALVPGAPRVLQPTSQLFTVLKKGAVYSLVVVSMNLLNGFTGLFSLGRQASCCWALIPTPFSPSLWTRKTPFTTCSAAPR